MAASINGKLGQLVNEYYIGYGSIEQKKIDASVATLKSKLKNHFGENVQNIVEFTRTRETLFYRENMTNIPTLT